MSLENPIRVDGKNLSPGMVVAVARDNQRISLSTTGRNRASDAHNAIKKISKHREIYGQSTGVGSNKKASVSDEANHAVKLIRSHAAGAGPEISSELKRAMLVVRLNQLAAGGSGVNPELLDFLVEVINQRLLPPVSRFGAIGTGDLTALATTALCIMGEMPWQNGSTKTFAMDGTEALAFMSSSAATYGEAAIACYDISQRLKAGIKVAALTYLAQNGSWEAYSKEVHDGRPQSQSDVAAEMRRLLGRDLKSPNMRIQDSYGLRAFPQVHGPAIASANRLENVLHVQLNAASENPLVGISPEEIFHNGNFHSAYLGLTLDELRAAIFGTASLSVARLGTLMEPESTKQNPFLAADSKGSSGLLILEYVAHSALAELRHLANPDSLGSAVMSHGTEEHASFETQSSWHTTEAVKTYETILACELISAVRSLRQQKIIPKGPLKEFYETAISVSDTNMADRPLHADIAAATELIKRI